MLRTIDSFRYKCEKQRLISNMRPIFSLMYRTFFYTIFALVRKVVRIVSLTENPWRRDRKNAGARLRLREPHEPAEVAPEVSVPRGYIEG